MMVRLALAFGPAEYFALMVLAFVPRCDGARARRGPRGC